MFSVLSYLGTIPTMLCISFSSSLSHKIFISFSSALFVIMNAGSYAEGRAPEHGKNAEEGRSGSDISKKCHSKASGNRFL